MGRQTTGMQGATQGTTQGSTESRTQASQSRGTNICWEGVLDEAIAHRIATNYSK